MKQSTQPAKRTDSRQAEPGRRASSPGPGAGPLLGPGVGNRTAASVFAPVAGDALEREAGEVAGNLVRQEGRPGRGSLAVRGASRALLIRRAAKTGGPAREEPAPEAASAESTGRDAETQRTVPAATLLVDDEAEAGPGQMRKSEFLAALRESVCATVDQGMAGTGQDSQGCPWIDFWLDSYREKSAAHVEKAIRRFAPDAGRAASAREYLPAVARRVRQSVDSFARTGELTGLPDDLPGPAAMAGGGLLGAFGGMFFKARPGGPRPADPVSVRQELGSGQPMPGALRARMESSFGAPFSGVRLHTDASAAQLSNRLNARAFTVGEHIAFGPGEFQPGTLMGDALIAHELAHVAQQRRGGAAGSPATASDPGRAALEEDADRSALTAMAASAWGAAREIGRNALPRARAGLALQRCGTKYVTNRGAGVSSLSSGAPPGAPDLTEAEANATLDSFGLRSRVTQLRPPSNGYDCHGYTFTGGNDWINDDQVESILTDNGYALTAAPAVGDIIVYRLGGSITHSGIVTSVSGGAVTQVESKWGRLGLYRHAPGDVPPGYGSWAIYHSDRAGGHQLRPRQ